jgi:hypothetical protein
MSTFQLILIGGIVGIIGVSHIADALITKDAINLDAGVRARIWERQARSALWWRVIEFIGMVLIAVGVLRTWGILKLTNSPFTCIAIGMAIYCLSSILKSWSAQRSYNVEAPGTPASRSAATAAMLTTVAELVLGAGICWYVFANRVPPGGKPPLGPTTQAPMPANSNQKPSTAAGGAEWVDQAEALKLIKKDADYLEVLVRRTDVRAREIGGAKQYLRSDIDQMITQTGLPDEDELADDIKKVRAERSNTPEPEAQ